MKIDGKHKVIVMAPDKVVIDTTGNITIHGGVSVAVEGDMVHVDDGKIGTVNGGAAGKPHPKREEAFDPGCVDVESISFDGHGQGTQVSISTNNDYGNEFTSLVSCGKEYIGCMFYSRVRTELTPGGAIHTYRLTRISPMRCDPSLIKGTVAIHSFLKKGNHE